MDPRRQVVVESDLWDCLHFENSDASGTGVLDGGRWFPIARAFAREVDAYAASLGPSGLALSPAGFGETSRG